MGQYYDLKEITTKINDLKKTGIELKKLSHGIPAIDVNVDRILSNVRILEINISEAADVLED